jgi:tetratricopeptide (TPR) repeat protein
MASWRVHLYGRFRLLKPGGELVRLPTRKVEGLLAMLAINRADGLSKAEIQRELWPTGANGNSFRQALHQLRKSLGEGAIESDGAVCRVSDRFPLECDVTNPKLRDSEAFMPGQLGDWFERRRVELAADEPGTSRSQVIDSLLVALEWLAASDPNAFFAVMEAAPALVRGIHHARLAQLVRTVACRTDLQRAWALYWQGTAENDLPTCARLLNHGLAISRSLKEIPLQSEICLELGKVYTRLGRTTDALAVGQIADSLAGCTENRMVQANRHRLAGTIRVHWGDYENGLCRLELAEEFIDDPLEAAIAMGARAFFSASIGRDEVAGRLIAEARRLANGLEHDRVARTTDLAEILVAARAGCRSQAIEKLVTTSARGAGTPSQVVVYADELLAKLFYLEGDRDLAHDRFDRAHRGRLSSRMVMTRLEARRLSRRHP